MDKKELHKELLDAINMEQELEGIVEQLIEITKSFEVYERDWNLGEKNRLETIAPTKNERSMFLDLLIKSSITVLIFTYIN